MRSFERIEARVESFSSLLENASQAVSSYFCKMGGDPLNDSSFDDYCDTETNIIGEIEILRESYHELLKDKGLLNIVPPKPEVTQSELIKAMETLAESTGKHATATEAQAKAALHHHKVPKMPMPTFNPADMKNNPLAWSNFMERFELFCIDAVDDKSRLGFLPSAVSGDALGLIKNLKCTDANFKVAIGLLEEQYNKPDAIREQLLLNCIKFRVPKVNADLTNFVSSIINLNVYISELKINHDIDILAEDSGCHLIRAVVHDILPGDILDKYQSITGEEYPSLK